MIHRTGIQKVEGERKSTDYGGRKAFFMKENTDLRFGLPRNLTKMPTASYGAQFQGVQLQRDGRAQEDQPPSTY